MTEPNDREPDREPGRERTSRYWRLSLGFIVAASSAIGYLLAYLWEAGYGSVFGVPREFIVLDVTRVLIAISAVASFFFVASVFAGAYFIAGWFSARHGQGRGGSRLVVLMVLLLSWGLLTLRWPSLWAIWIAYLLPVAATFVVSTVVVPWIIRRLPERLRAGLDAIEKWCASKVPRLPRPAFAAVLIVITVALGLYLSHESGQATAMSQKDFFVPSTNQNSVVLRIYGDNLICAPFDRGNKTVERSFFVLKVDDDPRPVLTLEKVGPLTSKANDSEKPPEPE